MERRSCACARTARTNGKSIDISSGGNLSKQIQGQCTPWVGYGARHEQAIFRQRRVKANIPAKDLSALTKQHAPLIVKVTMPFTNNCTTRVTGVSLWLHSWLTIDHCRFYPDVRRCNTQQNKSCEHLINTGQKKLPDARSTI